MVCDCLVDGVFRFVRAIRRASFLWCMDQKLFSAMGSQQVAYKLPEPTLRGKLPLNTVVPALLWLNHTADGVNYSGLHNWFLLHSMSHTQIYEYGDQNSTLAATERRLVVKTDSR